MDCLRSVGSSRCDGDGTDHDEDSEDDSSHYQGSAAAGDGSGPFLLSSERSLALDRIDKTSERLEINLLLASRRVDGIVEMALSLSAAALILLTSLLFLCLNPFEYSLVERTLCLVFLLLGAAFQATTRRPLCRTAFPLETSQQSSIDRVEKEKGAEVAHFTDGDGTIGICDLLRGIDEREVLAVNGEGFVDVAEIEFMLGLFIRYSNKLEPVLAVFDGKEGWEGSEDCIEDVSRAN